MCISFHQKGMMCMKNASTNNDKYTKWTSLKAFIPVLLTGLIIGSLTNRTALNIRWLNGVFYGIGSNVTVIDEVKNTFFISLVFLTAAFLLGLFALGQPLLYLLLFGLGSIIGSCAESMYSFYGKNAVLLILMTLIPKAAVLSATVILSVRVSFRSSSSLLYAFMNGDVRDGSETYLRLYCVRYTVLMLLSLVFAAVVGIFDYLYLAICR